MTTEQRLPETHRALYLTSFDEPLAVKSLPTPKPTPGSVIVRILVTDVLAYARDVYSGKQSYPMPKPLVIGSNAIARVAAVGTDAATLTPGQLVLVDVNITARDDPGVGFLFGLHSGATAASQKLMADEWRDSTYAEYAKVPLENVCKLNEKKLLGSVEQGGFGYRMEDLAYVLRQLVPHGGLKDINVKPGETVIVAPATGAFGGAAVEVAEAMGARVIAAGRNINALKEIQKGRDRVEVVQLLGDVMADAEALQQFGPVDAFIDFSPPAAAKSTHIESCPLALKPHGRAALMGGVSEYISIPYPVVMFKSLMLKGRFMYDREAVGRLVSMVEAGLIKLGPRAGLRVIGPFGLEDWQKAFDEAAKNSGWGVQTLLKP